MRIAEKLRRSIVGLLMLSAAVHLAITALVLFIRQHHKAAVVVQAIKYYPAAIYYPGSSTAPKSDAPEGRKRHQQQEVKPPASDLVISLQVAPAVGAPVSAPNSTAPGTGADQQSAYPAFPVFSPKPAVVDRSLLPRSNQDVVVDVKVSADGNVLDATLVKGLGNGLDQIVLDTVKTWRFHPATLNGTAVATEAELIFPFNLSYPTTPS